MPAPLLPDFAFSYNGVDLEQIKTISFPRQPIFDERGRYMYTEATLHVRGLLNPENVTYKRDVGNPNGPPVQVQGRVAAETDDAIQYFLQQPRKHLFYREAGIDMIDTPLMLAPNGDALYVDANGGPIPDIYVAKEVHGYKSFIVEFRCKTWLNESTLYMRTANPVIISNVWSMSSDIEPTHYKTTRTIRGRATFRTDRLHEINGIPDEFRQVLFHPVPKGFKREHVSVTAEESGAELEYTVVDIEQHMVVRENGVTRIEVQDEVRMVRKSNNERNWDTITNVTSFVFCGYRNVGGYGSTISGFIGRRYPATIKQSVVKVFGKVGVSEQYLSEIAWRVLASRMHVDLIQHSTEVVETRLPMEPSVTLAAVREGGFAEAQRVVGNFQAPNTSLQFTSPDAIGTPETIAAIDNGGSTTSPDRSNGTRGRYVGAIVAQVLQDATLITPIPANPANIQDRNAPL